MTKKSFLTLISAVFLVFMLTGCGDKKDDTTDTGDTAADADNTDTGDTAVISDEDNADTDEPETDSDSAETDDADFCEYEGLAGYEPGDIVLSFDFCKPLTCKNGKFAGVDGDFCDGCRYWNDPEKEGELGEMMKFSCNGEAERNWCECVKDDLGTKKWACYYSHACQCIYDDDGKRYDLGYEIATDFCQTSTCSDGFFDFLDWEACDYCYYYDEAEDTSKQAAIGDKRDFICPDGSKVDWCECVADDNLGQKWKCVDRADLNCSKK